MDTTLPLPTELPEVQAQAQGPSGPLAGFAFAAFAFAVLFIA